MIALSRPDPHMVDNVKQAFFIQIGFRRIVTQALYLLSSFCLMYGFIRMELTGMYSCKTILHAPFPALRLRGLSV